MQTVRRTGNLQQVWGARTRYRDLHNFDKISELREWDLKATSLRLLD
jgi:hypothetical protein